MQEGGIIIIKKTFSYKNELPSLPLPSLKSTEFKLLEWIEPLVSQAEFQETTKIVSQFFEENGEAEKLQEKLYEWNDKLEGSWLKPLWDDSYLRYRSSLPTGMNFNILLDNKINKNRYTLSEMVGKISRSVTELYHTIIDGEVVPVTLNKIPLDMSQYKNFFRSIRIPKKLKDEFRVAEFDKKNNHVVLMHNKNIYKINVSNKSGKIYSSKEIAARVEIIFQSESEEGLNVSIFTSTERNQAAKLYEDLITSKANEEILRIIADSLIVISMDEVSNNSEEAIENLMLSGINKYFDKTIQVIITKKGEIGYSIEHSSVDGTTIFAVISYVNDKLAIDEPEVVYTTEKPLIEKQEWEISERIKESLTKFEDDFIQSKKDFYIKSEIFQSFGAVEIKSMNLSPDAFFHMALQIAQYRTFGVFKSVYEPVSVRVFYEGRTECARATSMEKVALVKAIEKGKESNKALYSLMKKAGAAHSNRIIECRKGFGVERHMFGLEQMYYLHEKNSGLKKLPAIFKDKGYLTMRHDFISTSGMAYDNVKYRVFGPVVADGFGLAYIIMGESISINISSTDSEKYNVEKLMNNLLDALLELRAIARCQ